MAKTKHTSCCFLASIASRPEDRCQKLSFPPFPFPSSNASRQINLKDFNYFANPLALLDQTAMNLGLMDFCHLVFHVASWLAPHWTPLPGWSPNNHLIPSLPHWEPRAPCAYRWNSKPCKPPVLLSLRRRECLPFLPQKCWEDQTKTQVKARWKPQSSFAGS